MARRALLAACVVAAMAQVSAQDVPLPDALNKAAAYVATYRPKVSGVSLEELLLLTEMGTTQRVPRRLSSDIVLVNINDRLMALRDPFAIDTKPMRERQPRIVKALGEPTLASWQRVQEFTRENAYQLLANVVLWYSDPMLALRFIDAENQSRMTYKLEGRKKLNGVQVQGIGFKEKQERGKVYLLGTPSNPAASGRIWVDPATGAIHQTELWIQSDEDVARIQVIYAPDAKLGLLLPRDASHTFESYEKGTGLTNMGAGGAGRRMSFEANAKYTNAQYTPIDLSKIAK
jgi:hypothetical protein